MADDRSWWEDVLSTITGGATAALQNAVNIDFGDLVPVLTAIAGLDQSKQDPQYPTITDLYGGEFDDDMKDIRRQILGTSADDWVADLTPEQTAALDRAAGYGREGGVGYDTLRDQRMQGALGLSGLGGSYGYADALRRGGGPQFQYDQGTFDQSLGNLMWGLGGSYMDQTRDLFRNLTEQQIPGLNQAANASGNMASSRAGLTQGVLTRGALDRAGDIQSQLLQNALNQSQDAAMQGGIGNLRADLDTQGDIFGGYGSAAQYGLPGLEQAYRTGARNIDMLKQSGDFMQQYNQALLDAPRNLLGWQIGGINQTTPAGVGNLGTPFTSTSPLMGLMTGFDMGAGLWDAWQNATTPPAK